MHGKFSPSLSMHIDKGKLITHIQTGYINGGPGSTVNILKFRQIKYRAKRYGDSFLDRKVR